MIVIIESDGDKNPSHMNTSRIKKAITKPYVLLKVGAKIKRKQIAASSA